MVCWNIERTQHPLPNSLDGEEALRRVELRAERFFPCEVIRGRRKRLPRSRRVGSLSCSAQQFPRPLPHRRSEGKPRHPLSGSTVLIGVHVDGTLGGKTCGFIYTAV